MDLALLQAVVSELTPRLTEQELLRVGFHGPYQYLLRFATLERDNLLISIRPDLPRLHLMPLGVGRAEFPPDRFAAVADRELTGARLAGIQVSGVDRLVEMRFLRPAGIAGGAERVLVAELFGRSANLLLLDGEGVVLDLARESRGARDASIAGEPYRSRPPRPVLTTAESPRPGPIAPRVYSVRALAEIREGMSIGRDDLRVSATPLVPPPLDPATGGRLVETPFEQVSAAAQAAFDLVERLREFESGRSLHLGRIRKEILRLTSLDRRLGEDLAAAAGSDRDRRRAEALLAGMTHAKVTGSEVTLPDPESADGSLMTIPIEPGESLADNAARMFARWKKGKRSIVAIETRRAALRNRLAEWLLLEPRASAATSIADLRSLREEMERLGLVHAERATRRAPAAMPRDAPTRVRRHTTADGFVVLVGRSGPENDTLTFRVASPWDFWMHAAGTPGAHVVIRNPQRLKTLPDKTLTAAAAIAAWYSGAKDDGKVEVHYTQRKHVHKRRGMPAGQVVVRRFRSIQVAPRLPQPAIEDL
jgi:predicted ribosome quality control (RQC) complex YloA/Tae2 family protein